MNNESPTRACIFRAMKWETMEWPKDQFGAIKIGPARLTLATRQPIASYA